MDGSDITKLRKDAKLTQQDLADLLNVTRKTINVWERGGSVSFIVEVAIRKSIDDVINFKFDN